MALFRTHCWLWREFIEMKAIKLITRICNINNFKVKAACNHTYNFARPKSHTSYVTVPSKRLSLALKPWQTFSSLLIDVLSMILFLETQWFLLIMMHLILRSSSCSCVGAGLPCSGQYQMQSNLFEATLWPMRMQFKCSPICSKRHFDLWIQFQHSFSFSLNSIDLSSCENELAIFK